MPARRRPLGSARRDRALRPARPTGDDQGALCVRTTRLLDRRQWLLPPWPQIGRAARAALAQPRPRPPARPRQLAQPARDLLLDRPAQAARAERLRQPRRRCPHAQRFRTPLERDRRALRLALHPRRPRRAARPSCGARTPASAGRVIASELTVGSTKQRFSRLVGDDARGRVSPTLTPPRWWRRFWRRWTRSSRRSPSSLRPQTTTRF